MKKEILRMQDVRVGKEEPYALDGFNLHVSEGEIVGILGLSGSGKTTIYEYFMGLTPLNQGKVIYNGSVGREEYFNKVTDVVCIGQGSTLIPELSVAENIFIITGKRKVRGIVNMKHINYRANMLLSQYAPELSSTTPVRNLSPMQARIVELLRAVENEAKLVVIDDVFQGFGQEDTMRILELLKMLREKKIAIIYMCHDVNFIHSITDKLVVLRKGKNIRTFFDLDFDAQLCQQLLTGNEELPVFQRNYTENKREVLRIQNLTGPNYIKNLYITAKFGEIIGLYDMNNQGNMELISMLVGEMKSTQGTIYLDGQRFVPTNLDYAIKKGMGYIPRSAEAFGLITSMDFMDNLSLPILRKTGWLKVFRNMRLSDYLTKEYSQQLGIPYGERKRKMKFYDRYIQQSVIMQRWILFRPKVMACMEPTLNADVIMRDIIFKALDEMAGNGSAVLIASQNMQELKTVCDTIYVFNSSDRENVVRYNRDEF